MESYDIAVVGYGPTGMALAALAGREGHRVVVLERYSGLYNLPRAACFDDEVMRTFQKLGLVEEIGHGAVAQHDYEWVNGEGEVLLELTYDDPGRCGWPALHMMFQPDIEAVLDRHCSALPTVAIRQGVRVEGLEQDRDRVIVSGRDEDGRPVVVSARYAIGADGGAGFVREALGVGMASYGFEENWLVCDFHKRRELEHVPTFRQVCDPAQPVSIVRIGPQHHRFSFMLARGERRELATNHASVWRRVSPYLGPDDADLIRVANYVFRSRVAERWRVGRVLLAGDAAHEMPPFLAQGMCSGIRDAHNLAWKLHLVLGGHADERILDTYQPEREPHVRAITERAIELGRVQTLRDPEAARRRDEDLLRRRRAHETPEKLTFPPLSGGLVADAAWSPGAGELFVQGRVLGTQGEGLFDDVVGEGACIVARSASALAELRRDQIAWWASVGGRIALFSDSPESNHEHPGVIALQDVDGVYRAWFEEHGREAIVVRPDWYAYGSAADGAELAALLTRLDRQLRAVTVPAGV